MTAPRPAGRRRLSVRRRIAFALVPLALLLVAGELGVRLVRGRLLDLGDARRRSQLEALRASYPAEWDAALGHVPVPGVHEKNPWSTRVSIDSERLRSNGGTPPPGRPVLAVGDSFTFGDEVHDEESWPAALERRLGHRVLNAGVFGYGVDQAVLRAEAILEARRWDASALVISAIADDIRRCELVRHGGAWKPYFDLEGERGLVLRGVPVPRPRDDMPLLARSHLADAVLDRVAPAWWAEEFTRVRAHRDGLEVCRRLLERVRAAADVHGVRVLLVAQGTPHAGKRSRREDLSALLDHARSLGIATLDLDAELEAILRRSPELEARWIIGHMSGEGNAWVAARISQELLRRWPAIFARPPQGT